jgi:hypothetical protein
VINDRPGSCAPDDNLDTVPSWVSWIAQDSDGSIWGYSVEPLRNDTGWYENEVGECLRLGHSRVVDWRRSLRMVAANVVTD